ncbi:hypothetical protein QBC43DRAFT_365167 [Cladorrhinum sp. PSN259]|nr:hypothetical protein QBC43DRAFT_365167 [Cladorrhinum sp. PSN259]
MTARMRQRARALARGCPTQAGTLELDFVLRNESETDLVLFLRFWEVTSRYGNQARKEYGMPDWSPQNGVLLSSQTDFTATTLRGHCRYDVDTYLGIYYFNLFIVGFSVITPSPEKRLLIGSSNTATHPQSLVAATPVSWPDHRQGLSE